MAELSQRDRVLYELKEAGSKGVRSDHFFKLGMPRAAARIKELKDAGYEITSEHEHPFVVYRLAAGSKSLASGGKRAGGDTTLTDSSPGAVPSAQLFDPVEARTRPLSAFTDQEAA